MKKKILISFAILAPLAFGAAIIGYQDWQLRGSAPGNPASGYLRIWADNSAGYFKCLTSGGSACYFAANAASSVSGILPVANGGTGTSSPGIVAGTNVTSVTGTWPNQTINAATQTTTVVHSIGANFDGSGSALTTGTKVYFTVPFACTINAWDITADTGTITIDAWKIATGAAIPTISNTITASATPALSTGTALHSTTLTGWTTSVSANDIVAFDITAVSGATKASLVLQCQ